MEENKTYIYDTSYDASANSIGGYTITSRPYNTISVDEEWLKENLVDYDSRSLKDVELPEDKTSVDLAKLTSEVIIKFLRSPEGISLLANELDKYFKK